MVVVDHDDRLDSPADSRFDFSDMVQKAGVPRKAEYGPVRAGAFGPQGGRKSPSQVAGAADIPLAGTGQIQKSPCPHPRVSRVHHHYGVGGEVFRQLPADPLGTDRNGVGMKLGGDFLPPLGHHRLRAQGPLPSECRGCAVRNADELLQRHLCIAQNGRLQRIIPPQRFGVDIDCTTGFPKEGTCHMLVVIPPAWLPI